MIGQAESAVQNIVKARVKLNNLAVAVSRLGLTGDNEKDYPVAREIMGEISELLVNAEITLQKEIDAHIS